MAQELHVGHFKKTELQWPGPSLGSAESVAQLCSTWLSLLLFGLLFLVSSGPQVQMDNQQLLIRLKAES